MEKLLNLKRRRLKTFLAIYLFPSDKFFDNFLFKGDNFVHQNYAIKNIGLNARLRVKRRDCLSRFLISKRQNSPCFRNACASSLTCFENCFSVYDEICVNCKFAPI